MQLLLTSPKMKHLDVNLTKYVQDLSEENYQILMKKIKELNTWKDSPCSWMGRLNIVSSLQLSP